MAANTKLTPVVSSNGVLTAPPKGIVGGNRKKQKRRAKQTVKPSQSNSLPPEPEAAPEDVDYDEDALGYGEEEYEFSDGDADQYDDHMSSENAQPTSNGLHPPHAEAGGKKKKKKKKSAASEQLHSHMLPSLSNPPPLSQAAVRPGHKGSHQNEAFWNTSTQQERRNIKDFWYGLSEEERKGLLKIEKEAVLKKMKQSNKHSCSCQVCGRKRTAIEEELEVLYEGYYEELESFAHHDQPALPSTDAMMPDPLQRRRPPAHQLALPAPTAHQQPPYQRRTSQMHEHLDDEEFSGEGDEEEEEEFSEEEEELSEDELEPEPEPRGVPDFFNFGEQLTVKGILTPWVDTLKWKHGLKGKADNLLTVADDLLKNDGRKFIEMMEQLAERRMQRESRSQYDSDAHSPYPSDDAAYNTHEDSVVAGEEYDEDEGSYDGTEEYDDDVDEEDDMVGLTAEQRMKEGRRMFQIFAARMFEQRVLTAYREKVARERQQKLLEEIDDEDRQQAQKEAKKQRDAQKKKDKKKQQQQAKAEEKARKDAEKAAEEARMKMEDEKKQEDQRRKKEEQRKKREEEKRKLDEERARKEAERLRRQQEEQQRREELERKAREQKTKKEEARKREREEREAREKEAKDRKMQEDKERKEREVKVKAEKEAKEREKTSQQAPHPPQIQKRPSQAGMVAIPGVHPKQTASNISSPHPSVATPAIPNIPKAPTPAMKQRRPSQQGTGVVSPKQSQQQLSSATSKSTSPGSTGSQLAGPPMKNILPRTANHQQPQSQTGPAHPHQIPVQAPPGMHQGPNLQAGFGMPPMGFQGFPGSQAPMLNNSMGARGGLPMYPHQSLPMGGPNRMPFVPGMGNIPPPPPGMMQPHAGRGMFPFDSPMGGQPPPGFGLPSPHPSNQTSPIGQQPTSLGADGPRASLPPHSRQTSISEKERFESAANLPIARPAPIQRPSSVKPDRKGSSSDIDDLSKHLGSSALLDDSDEPIAPLVYDTRRHSGMSRTSVSHSIPGGFGAPISGFGVPSGGSSWNAPPMPFGQTPVLGHQPSWGSLPGPSSSWGTNPTPGVISGSPFPSGPPHFSSLTGSIVGPPPHHHRPSGASLNRPLTLRLALCQACKHLTSISSLPPSSDGFHPIEALLRQIDLSSSFRPFFLDSPPSLSEIEAICETEGDAQNGGGELHLRKHANATATGGGSFDVKWEPDAGTPDPGRGGPGLGEIGSPMPSRVSPAMGFGGANNGHFHQQVHPHISQQLR